MSCNVDQQRTRYCRISCTDKVKVLKVLGLVMASQGQPMTCRCVLNGNDVCERLWTIRSVVDKRVVPQVPSELCHLRPDVLWTGQTTQSYVTVVPACVHDHIKNLLSKYTVPFTTLPALCVLCRDHVTNETVLDSRPEKEITSKLKYFGQISCHTSLEKDIMHCWALCQASGDREANGKNGQMTLWNGPARQYRTWSGRQRTDRRFKDSFRRSPMLANRVWHLDWCLKW